MPSILLESGGSLLSVLGGAILLETGVSAGNSVYFNCAELLGIQHSCNFWGNAINYSSTDNYSIKGRVTGSYENVTGVWNGMDYFMPYTTGVKQIYLNGISVGYGRIAGISFDKGTDVGYKTYSASLIFDRHAGTGLYSNTGYIPASGGYYTGLGLKIEDCFRSSTGKYIKSFSLDSQTSFESSGQYGRTKNASFSLDGGIYDEFGVDPNTYASVLIGAAKNSFGDAEIVTAFYPDFYKTGGAISRTSQEFDAINYQYSFSETFDFQTGLPYTWDFSHSLDLNGAIISITENGTITSAQKSGTYLGAASGAWNSIQTGIYGRVSGVFAGYTGAIGYSGGCGVFDYPEQSSVSRDHYNGSVRYSQTFSNSPFTNSGYSFSYSDKVSLGEDGYITVSEDGEFKAFRNIRPSGFNIARSGYIANTGAILTRLNSLYNSSTGSLRSCYITGLNLVSKEETYQEYDGVVQYSYSYSDNPKYLSTPLFYNMNVSTDDSLPTHIFNYYPVNYSNIVAQRATQSTRGVMSNKITLMGKSGTNLNDFVTGGLSLLRKPSGASDIYASDYQYSIDPLNKSFEMELVYNYTRYRGPNDYLV